MIRTRFVQTSLKVVLTFFFVRCFSSHSIFILIDSLLQHHPVPFIMSPFSSSLTSSYCSICVGISFFFTYTQLATLSKPITFTVFALLKLIPLCLLLNCSSSVQVSLTIAVATFLLGIISGQLKMDNLWPPKFELTGRRKELRLVVNCLSSDFMSTGGGCTGDLSFADALEVAQALDEFTYNRLRCTLQELREYLRVVVVRGACEA